MAESISIVDIRASVRLRPAMYFGCTTSRGVVHVVNELVSNGIDQFLHRRASRVSIAFDENTIDYSDDGPGLPFDVTGPGNVSLAEHYLTCHHTTPTADDHAPHIHMLSHGLGLVCVNAVSEHFGVKSWRSGRLWEQNFAEGKPVDSAHIVEQGNGKGTSICFRLDSTVFKDLLPCPRTLRRLIFEAAHLFAGVSLALSQEVFHAKNGLADLASLYYQRTSPFEWQEPEPFALNIRYDDVEKARADLGGRPVNGMTRLELALSRERAWEVSGVFAPLVGASVFKTAGGLEERPQWVRFPYTPANFASRSKPPSRELQGALDVLASTVAP